MVQRGQDFGLALEAGQAIRVGSEGLGQNLERDVPFQASCREHGRPRPCRRRRAAL